MGRIERCVERAARVLGELIATGRTSKVYAYGTDSVAKVLDPGVPDHWASVEALYTGAVRAVGVPAPEVRDVIVVDGRPAVVFERIIGVSMWQQMLDTPSAVPQLVDQFADVHRGIGSAGVPEGLPSLVERMSSKVAEVASLPDDERSTAQEIIDSLPRGTALLHGDLHPGNVLLAPTGPVVIDWFDASVGHPVADVVRSSLLLRSSGATDLRHLPGASAHELEKIHDSYVQRMAGMLLRAGDRLGDWEAVIAVSRLAERTDADPIGLHALWRARTSPAPSALTALLSSV